MIHLESFDSKLVAIINTNRHDKQLASLRYDDWQYMHGGGRTEESKSDSDKRGWSNSEIIMFPVVGPVKDSQVLVDGESYPMGQHGISRYLPFEEINHNKTTAVFCQKYVANTPVLNPKDKGPKEFTWPFSFNIKKKYNANRDGVLTVNFSITNTSDRPMPYQFGWHPAFRTLGDNTKNAQIYVLGASEDNCPLDSIRSDIGIAKKIEHGTVCYQNQDKSIELTSDMGKTMIWSPSGSDLVCLEPVTKLPVEPFDDFTDMRLIKPGKKVMYQVSIRLSSGRDF